MQNTAVVGALGAIIRVEILEFPGPVESLRTLTVEIPTPPEASYNLVRGGNLSVLVNKKLRIFLADLLDVFFYLFLIEFIAAIDAERLLLIVEGCIFENIVTTDLREILIQFIIEFSGELRIQRGVVKETSNGECAGGALSERRDR